MRDQTNYLIDVNILPATHKRLQSYSEIKNLSEKKTVNIPIVAMTANAF